MAYTIINPILGVMPISGIDAGYTPPNASSAIPSTPMYAGMVVVAQDPTLGMGEFILLLGVASTIVGALVKYNASTYQTALTTHVPVQAVPVAVAMSANLAGTWAWYQISGLAVIKKTAVQLTPQVTLALSSTVGRVKGTSTSGMQIAGCRSANLATVTSTTSTITALLDRPHLQTQIV